MKEIISKELLGEVLGNKLQVGSVGVVSHEELNYFLTDGDMESINIHKLALKCKEWVNREGNCVLLIKFAPSFTQVFLRALIGEIRKEPFCADTEHEAIFKATQWIHEKETK